MTTRGPAPPSTRGRRPRRRGRAAGPRPSGGGGGTGSRADPRAAGRGCGRRRAPAGVYSLEQGEERLPLRCGGDADRTALARPRDRVEDLEAVEDELEGQRLAVRAVP